MSRHLRDREGSDCRTCTHIAIASRLRTTFGGSLLGAERCNAAAASTIERPRTDVMVIQYSTDHRGAKVFRAHLAPQGMCDNLTSALKLLSNQQKDGDSPVRMIVPGLQGSSRRRIMDGLKLFMAVDSSAAVKIGNLQKETRSKKW